MVIDAFGAIIRTGEGIVGVTCAGGAPYYLRSRHVLRKSVAWPIIGIETARTKVAKPNSDMTEASPSKSSLLAVRREEGIMRGKDLALISANRLARCGRI